MSVGDPGPPVVATGVLLVRSGGASMGPRERRWTRICISVSEAEALSGIWVIVATVCSRRPTIDGVGRSAHCQKVAFHVTSANAA